MIKKLGKNMSPKINCLFSELHQNSFMTLQLIYSVVLE